LLPPLEKAFSRLQRASLGIARRGLADPEEAAAAADDYLRLFGITALAFAWGEILAGLARRPELAALDPETARYPALARHYVEKILPETGALFARIAAGKASLPAEALPA
jgi:butyryl-CoA dehydrogenase